MSEAELDGWHLYGSREIDEYLRGTIYAAESNEEDLDDIEALDDDNFEVSFADEPGEFEDEYLGRTGSAGNFL